MCSLLLPEILKAPKIGLREFISYLVAPHLDVVLLGFHELTMLVPASLAGKNFLGSTTGLELI